MNPIAKTSLITIAAALIAHGETAQQFSFDSGNHPDLHGAKIGAGKKGKALILDGVDDYADISPIDLPGKAITLAAWIRAERWNHSPCHDARILSKATGTTENDHVWMLSGWKDKGKSRLRARLKIDGKTRTLVASNHELPANLWTHVAATFDGNTFSLYQDAQLVASTKVSGEIKPAPDVSAWIGANPPTATDRPFHGSIDEVHILARSLDATKITHLAGISPSGPRNASSADLSAKASATAEAPPPMSAPKPKRSAKPTSHSLPLVAHPPTPGSKIRFRHHYIDRAIPGKSWFGLSAADFDGDGRTDIALGKSPWGGAPHVIFGWRNLGGIDKWSERSHLADRSGKEATFTIHDVDRDGDLDIYADDMEHLHMPPSRASSGGTMSAWENLDGSATNWRRIPIITGLGGHEAQAADFDGDGDLDLLTKPYTAGPNANGGKLHLSILENLAR